VFAYAGNPPVYSCRKKLPGERPWVCGNYRYKCILGVTTDGCSVPKNTRKVLRFWNARFRKACEAHDLCYTLGTSKKKCDSDFLKAMRRTCGPLISLRGGSGDQTACFTMAAAYYAEVATAKRHNSAFSDDQKWKNRKVGKSNKVNCVKF
jgi:hypothetical protein